MSEPFVAEIRIFPFNFAPRGWALCNGQLLPIAQNTALFSLVGTYYGGNGKSNFALPNMQGNAPMQWGQGQGLSLRDLGEQGGAPSVTLLQSEIPNHTHAITASQADGIERIPAGQLLATGIGIGQYAAPGALTQLSPNAGLPAGGSLPHNNMQPFLVLNFCIAMQGIYPQRQ